MWAGQDDTQKFKTRVLKPPGGGTSDIFGAAPEDASPRRVKNHHQSQVGSALFGENNGMESPRMNSKPGNDSYKRLFGPPDAPPTPNSKNHMRSNIPFSGGRTVTSPAKSTSSSGSSNDSNIICNEMLTNGNHKDFTEGNPITGTGYGSETSVTDSSSSSPTPNGNSGSEKSNDSTPSSNGIPNIKRNRVPPGGYSSGLW